MIWSLPFPPLQDSSGLLSPSVTSFPSSLSFLPICLLSARFCLFSRPPPVSIPHIVRPPSSVRQKYTNPPTSADQCLLLVSFPRVPYAGFHPPRPERLVVLGLGVGGGAKETTPPAMVVNVRFLCFPVDDDVVPSFYPLRDSSGLLSPSVTSCPSSLSFLPICLLSARFCLFSRPPPVSIPHIVRPPSSVCQKYTNPPTSADQCLLLVSFPSVPYAGLHPPPT